MKTIAAALLLLAYSAWTAPAQKADATAPMVRLTAAQAGHYIGTNAVVSGKVVEVHKSRSVVHLNFEKAYPNSPFTAVIFAANTNRFPDPDTFKDKSLRITGKISSYQGRPEIILTSTNQLAIIEKAPEAEKKP